MERTDLMVLSREFCREYWKGDEKALNEANPVLPGFGLGQGQGRHLTRTVTV